MQSVQSLSMQLQDHDNRRPGGRQHSGASTSNQVAELAAAISTLSAPMGVSSDTSGSSNSCHLINFHQQLSGSSLSSLAGAGGSGNGLAQGNKLGRLVGKKASRVKELLMQNLGRADKTTDELFNLYEENFFKQHYQAIRISKEFKNYLNSMKSFHESSKSLNNFIKQSTSDYQAARHDLICENLSQLEQLNEDLLEKLREQILQNIDDYLGQFDELKQKISKRHRKLIDFDSSRRAFNMVLNQINKKRLKQQQQHSNDAANNQQDRQQQQQQSQLARGLRFLSQQQLQTETAACQLVDEARLLKLREQFNYCRLMYETINSELHDILPIVYEKKMKILWKMLHHYFALEAHYNSNAGKLMATALDVIDEAPIEFSGAISLMKQKQQQQKQQTGDIVGQTTGSSVELYQNCESGDKSGSSLANRCGGGASSSGMGSSRGDSSSSLDDDEDDDDDDDLAASLGLPDIGQHVGGEYEQSTSGLDNSGPVVENNSRDAIGVDDDDDDDDATDSGKVAAPADCCVVADGDSMAVAAAAATHHQESPAGRQITGASVVGVADDKVEIAQDDAGKPQVMQQADASADTSEATAEAATIDCPVDEADEQGHIKSMAPKRDVGNELTESKSKCNGAIQIDANQEESVAIVESNVSDQQLTSSIIMGSSEQQQQQQQAGENSIQIGGEQDCACLYKVQTNYKYLAEDVDELCFEADEIIQVIDFDESHEPEDGWLMGIREVNGQRGLFPANFTRPL